MYTVEDLTRIDSVENLLAEEETLEFTRGRVTDLLKVLHLCGKSMKKSLVPSLSLLSLLFSLFLCHSLPFFFLLLPGLPGGHRSGGQVEGF